MGIICVNCEATGLSLDFTPANACVACLGTLEPLRLFLNTASFGHDVESPTSSEANDDQQEFLIQQTILVPHPDALVVVDHFRSSTLSVAYDVHLEPNK